MIKGINMNRILLLMMIIISGYQIESYSQTKETDKYNDRILDRLIQRTIEVSPKLNSLKKKQQAAETEADQVSNLPDPVLKLGVVNLPTNSFSFTQEPMTGKIAGLSQSIPFPGRLSAAGEVKNINPEIIQQELDDYTNELKMKVKNNYYDLANIRKTINLTKESKRLLESILKVVATKYKVLKASQQNLIHAQTEITRIEDKIMQLENKERTFQSNINVLILEDPANKVETGDLPEITTRELSVNLLDSLAQKYRPYLKGVKLQEEQARLMKEAAEYEFYPNFNLSLQYTQREEIAASNTNLNDLVSMIVGISLPINYGGKKSASVEEAQLKGEMIADQYQAARQMLYENFAASISKMRELEEREALIIDGLIPQTYQSYKASLAAYQVDEVDFINVIDAQNKLLQVETEMYNIRTDYFKEKSKLEFLIGTTLN
jgi:outer membrane protein TolC